MSLCACNKSAVTYAGNYGAPHCGTKVYVDNNSTTRMDESVLRAMMPYMAGVKGGFQGNPNSLHSAGAAAREGIRKAVDQVYAAINAKDEDDVIMTGCACEADNTVIQSVLMAQRMRAKKGLTRTHVITTSVEHPAVTNSCGYLESMGVAVTYLPVNKDGIIDPETVRKAIEPDNTVLVSVMWANNETGLINPIKEISKVIADINAENASKRRMSGDTNDLLPILFHVDAVQALGKVIVDVQDAGVDMLVGAAHKFHGPKGVGFLYVRAGSHWLEHSRGWFAPLIYGGEQMAGRRAGTTNTAGIVGLGAAIEAANRHVRGLDQDHADENGEPICSIATMRKLRDELEDGLLAIPGVRVIGKRELRTPNTILASFAGVEGEAMLWDLDSAGVAASTGSACASESLQANPTFVAMSVDPELSHTGIRFSLSKYNTKEDIEYVLKAVNDAVTRLRGISGIHPTK